MHKVKLFFSFIFLGAILTGCGDDDSSSDLISGSSDLTTEEGKASGEVVSKLLSNISTPGNSINFAKIANVMRSKLNTKPMVSCSLYTDFGITFPTTDADGCVTDCSGSTWSYTCAEGTREDETFECDGTTYTMTDQSMSSEMDMSDFDVDEVTGTVSGSMDMSADFATTVTGGALESATDIECSISMTMDVTAASYDFDCDSSFSCTVGGTAISCADMMTLQADAGC